jgi:quinolinate synthase
MNFIVATEAGILHQMHKEVPQEILIPAPAHEDNTCACSECPYMKMNAMEKLYQSLLLEQPDVHVDEVVRSKAAQALAPMLTLS